MGFHINLVLHLLIRNLSLLKHGQLVSEASCAVLVELPRRQIGLEQLVNLFQVTALYCGLIEWLVSGEISTAFFFSLFAPRVRTNLELWHAEPRPNRGQDGEAAPDVGQPSTNLAEEIGGYENDYKADYHVECSLKTSSSSR